MDMYIQYCFIAVATIIVISLFVYYLMKKNNQANKKNIVNLVLCTVITILTAILTPPVAKVFVRELSFPMLGAVIITVILFICLICALFYLLESKLTKLYGEEPAQDTDETSNENTLTIEDSSQQEEQPILDKKEEAEEQTEYKEDNLVLQLKSVIDEEEEPVIHFESEEAEAEPQIEYQDQDLVLSLESEEEELEPQTDYQEGEQVLRFESEEVEAEPQIEYQDQDLALSLESEESEAEPQTDYQEGEQVLRLESEEVEAEPQIEYQEDTNEKLPENEEVEEKYQIEYDEYKQEDDEPVEVEPVEVLGNFGKSSEIDEDSKILADETSREFTMDNREDILKILEKAMDDKDNKDYEAAIKAYEAALVLRPDKELCYLIILDLCSLYKMTGQTELVYKLLDSNPCELLDSDKKADIIRNINI